MSFFSNLMSGLGAAGGAMSQSFEEIQRQDLARAEARAREMATNRQLQQRANESLMNFESDRRDREATQQQHLETMAAGTARDLATLDYRTDTARLTAEDRAGMRQLDISQADEAAARARLPQRDDETYIFLGDDLFVDAGLATAAVRGAEGDTDHAIARLQSLTRNPDGTQQFTAEQAERAVTIALERGQLMPPTGPLVPGGTPEEVEEEKPKSSFFNLDFSPVRPMGEEDFPNPNPRRMTGTPYAQPPISPEALSSFQPFGGQSTLDEIDARSTLMSERAMMRIESGEREEDVMPELEQQLAQLEQERLRLQHSSYMGRE